MTDWFEWRGDNFYAVRGEDLYLCGCAVKRDGEDKWDAYAHGEAVGVYVSKAGARGRVETLVRGRQPAIAGSTGARATRSRPAKLQRNDADSGYEPQRKFNW